MTELEKVTLDRDALECDLHDALVMLHQVLGCSRTGDCKKCKLECRLDDGPGDRAGLFLAEHGVKDGSPPEALATFRRQFVPRDQIVALVKGADESNMAWVSRDSLADAVEYVRPVADADGSNGESDL